MIFLSFAQNNIRQSRLSMFNFHQTVKSISFKQQCNIRPYSAVTDARTIFSAKPLQEILRVQYKANFDDFPYVWLRDNCQCDECFHPVSKSRLISCETFDVNPKPKNVTVSEDIINILWDDKHSSNYDATWLQERSFTTENIKEYLHTVYKPEKKTWNAENFQSIFKKFDFNDVINNDEQLKDWIEALIVYGVALIINVPSDHTSCRKLANRVEFIKRTHYGEEFIVQDKPDTTNVAYLSSTLQPHSDLTYYNHGPGVILLHCVNQTLRKGGENMLADGLYCANQIKQHNNEYYKVLSETLVNWEDYGVENGNRFHSLNRAPVISTDQEGTITRLNFSVPQRSSHFSVPLEKVKPWYVALKHYIELFHENSAMFKSSSGELLCIDNSRLLHSRNGYTDTADNSRYLIGVYLDWDYLHSRFRVLSGK